METLPYAIPLQIVFWDHLQIKWRPEPSPVLSRYFPSLTKEESATDLRGEKWKRGRKNVPPVFFTFFMSVVTFHNKSVTLVNNDVHQWHTLQRLVCHCFLFLPHFDVVCDLLLNRRRASWNLLLWFFISLTKVRPKKSFLEEIIPIYKPVGQRENCKDINIPFLCTL